MITIFNTILPIFLLMIIGNVIKRYWLTSNEFWRGTEKLSYFLLFPCALFQYIVSADLNSSQTMSVALLLIIATSLLASGLVIYKYKYNLDAKIFTSIFQGSLRYNNYIFFGVGSALYKEHGLSLIAIIALYLIVFTNVISILAFNIFSDKQDDSDYFYRLLNLIKKFTLNPMIFASLAAVIFNKLEMQIGSSLNSLLKNLSDSALTIGIITVGSALRLSITNTEQFRPILIATLNKLIILPLITYALFSICHIEGIARNIGMLYSCLPCATTSYILSKQLGGDSELMASIITFTTICSIISLSFLMYILI